MKALFSGVVCSFACAVVCGEFVNLTFDKADLTRLAVDPSTGVPSAPIGDMIPGWEVSLLSLNDGWQPYTGLVEFTQGFGGTPVAVGTFATYGNSGYSVTMQAIPAIGFPPGPRKPDVRLSTKGMVPANALTFDWYEGTSFDLTVSDGSITLAKEIDRTSMDVSQFAGKEVTISFLQRSGGAGLVDVIGFSLVPEPETWALFGIGVVGLFAWRQCKRA